MGLAVVVALATAVGAAEVARSSAKAPSDADVKRHVAALQGKLPGEGFTIVVQRPFVVIGDESPEQVERRSRQTVRWAVEKLKAAYFERDPAEIIDVWLFKDDASYKTHCKQLFDITPTTPYGFCSHAHRALVMNISTGGGTLVHEIVHAYVAANFAECPAWFNEGLASLYEQCGEVDGKIHGYVNWRLTGLQKAIADDQLPSFKTLCSTTTHEFYERDKGANYSQARYLCLYLQEQGKLQKFYREFHSRRNDDPSGYQALVDVLGRNDMDVFQQEWQAWVLKLKR
jgi:hypothetical protein